MIWLEMAKYAGISSVFLFAFIAFCYGMGGQPGNMVVNIGITILYFGLFVMIITWKIF